MYTRGGKVVLFGETEGFVYLEKDWDGCRLPEDLVEEAGIAGTDFSLIAPIKRGVMGGYSKCGNNAVFIAERSQYPMILNEKTNLFLAGELNGWNPFLYPQKWKMTRNGNSWKLRMNWEELRQHSPFNFKFVTESGVWLDPPSGAPSVEKSSFGPYNFQFDQERTGKDVLTFKLIGPQKGDGLHFWINSRPIGKFGFNKNKQGVQSLRVFAPRAEQLDLLIYEDIQDLHPEKLPMAPQGDGSWTIEFKEDREFSLYKIAVLQKGIMASGKSFEKIILDPYARATMGRNGPGLMISEPSKVSDEERYNPPHLKDLVIVEAHVRDLLQNVVENFDTQQFSWFNELKKWLSKDSCYLKKLGVNAVELQPILEFDSRDKEEYHWGYMPVNFFSPASSFSSNLRRGGAINQFKSLVEAFHNAGIAVILDVVYNHVGVPGHLISLDRELYFRVDKLGRLENFSGCGNDLNCESEPVRKLILDSLVYLVEVFDVDGFRFDLGELLGFEFLQEIEKKLKLIKPNIALLAEPWSFRGRLPAEMKKTGYSLWSDACRESILSLVKNGEGVEEILNLMSGSLDEKSKPWHSLNYIESHDDYAFVDRICKNEDRSLKTFPLHLIEQTKLALFLTLFSPGVPMISAGQDFMRHKNGMRNTYQRGDLNALRYEDWEKYQGLSTEIQKMISFRLSDRGAFLRPQNGSDVTYRTWKQASAGTFGIIIKEKKRETFILVNFSPEEKRIDLPMEWRNAHCLLSSKLAKSKLNRYSYQVLEN